MAKHAFQEIVASRVEEIIRTQTGEDLELTPETDLLTDLAIDSLELVEMGIKIEKQFGKKFPIADLRSCITVGELIQLVQQVTSEEQVENV